MANNCRTQACREAHARTQGQKSDGRSAPGRDVSGQGGDDDTDFWDVYSGVHSDAHDFFMSIFGIEDSDGSALGDGSSSSSSDASDSWLAALFGGLASTSSDDTSNDDAGMTADELQSVLKSWGESQAREENTSSSSGLWSQLESWAKDHPIATGAAMAAGAYLWTRR